MTHHTIYCILHKDGAIYSTFNTQSGPVHLSCPPECRRLSVLLRGMQLVRTPIKGCHVWAAVGLRAAVKYFYKRSFAVLFANCALKHRVQWQCWRDRIARLYKMVGDTADWHSACVTQTCTSLAQIQMIHIVGKKLLSYTLLQDCNLIIPGIQLQHSFCSTVLYTTALLYIVTDCNP
jgi:hypothetical protein